MNPGKVRGYLHRAFGDELADVEAAMGELAAAYGKDDIGSNAYRLYENFRCSCRRQLVTRTTLSLSLVDQQTDLSCDVDIPSTMMSCDARAQANGLRWHPRLGCKGRPGGCLARALTCHMHVPAKMNRVTDTCTCIGVSRLYPNLHRILVCCMRWRISISKATSCVQRSLAGVVQDRQSGTSNIGSLA
jgi:hypothetical protein